MLRQACSLSCSSFCTEYLPARLRYLTLCHQRLVAHPPRVHVHIHVVALILFAFEFHEPPRAREDVCHVKVVLGVLSGPSPFEYLYIIQMARVGSGGKRVASDSLPRGGVRVKAQRRYVVARTVGDALLRGGPEALCCACPLQMQYST